MFHFNLKNKMKNKFKILATAILMAGTLGVTTSCSEDEIIDLKPFNSIDENLAFSTAGNVDLAVFGVYNAAANGFYYTSPDAANTPRGYIFGAAYIAQNDMRGEDMVNTATFYQVTYTAAYDGGTPNNWYYWDNGFALINKANIAIEGLNKAGASGIISEAAKNSYLGEMYYLRAMAYLELTKMFCQPYNYNGSNPHYGLPYFDFAINTPAAIDAAQQIGRGTVAETYTKILADFDKAEQLAPSKSTRTGNSKVARATKEAAIAMKVRAYLQMRDWNKVLSEGAKLNGVYTLVSDPSALFASIGATYSNTESIFSIENSATTNPGQNASPAALYNNRALVCISPIIWRNEKWLNDDKRRSEGSMVKTSAAGVKFSNKYKDFTTMAEATPIIRYAEVVLAMAEANARLGNTATAVDQLNLVRNRSLASPSTQEYTSSSFANASSLVEAIVTERRIEFLAEGNRWGDIHRLLYDDLAPTSGIPAKMANATPAAAAYTLGTPYTGPLNIAMIPKTDHRILWPIPTTTVVNSQIMNEQKNPGY